MWRKTQNTKLNSTDSLSHKILSGKIFKQSQKYKKVQKSWKLDGCLYTIFPQIAERVIYCPHLQRAPGLTLETGLYFEFPLFDIFGHIMA